MANPQKENGHTALANDIWDALAKYRLSGEEWKCLIVIIRKTYGWHKKSDRISLSQFSELANMKRQSASRALKSLSAKMLIGVNKNADNEPLEYRLEKDFEKWLPVNKKAYSKQKCLHTVNKNADNGVSKIAKGVSAKTLHTKETLTKERKETFTKEKYTASIQANELIGIFLGTMSSEFAEKFNSRENWGKCFDRLLKEFEFEKLRGLILHYRQDDFWCKNFMSPLKLLNKNKEGIRYVDYFFERMKYAGNGRGISNGIPAQLIIDPKWDQEHYYDNYLTVSSDGRAKIEEMVALYEANDNKLGSKDRATLKEWKRDLEESK